MIKLAKHVVTGPITSLINKSIETSFFPYQLKVAEVKPLFKNKNDQLDKTKYRLVSVLPTFSKFFERTIFDQLSSFFENHSHPFLLSLRNTFLHIFKITTHISSLNTLFSLMKVTK
jgi:hypothetical protein